MNGGELRSRIDGLNLPYARAAELLGLSTPGLHHQMRAERPVSRQTQLLVAFLERELAWRKRFGRFMPSDTASAHSAAAKAADAQAREGFLKQHRHAAPRDSGNRC